MVCRVSTANKNSGQQAFSYGYDQLGNRTSQSVTAGSGGTLSLSYLGNNNRMDGFTYDAAGNLQGDVLHNYAYDAENHLIAVDGGNTASYVYDAEVTPSSENDHGPGRIPLRPKREYRDRTKLHRRLVPRRNLCQQPAPGDVQ